MKRKTRGKIWIYLKTFLVERGYRLKNLFLNIKVSFYNTQNFSRSFRFLLRYKRLSEKFLLEKAGLVGQSALIIFVIFWTLGIPNWLPFMWPAKAATFTMQTGYYIGTGVDNLAITGIGFSPDLVIIAQESGTVGNDGALWKSSAMSGETTAKTSDAEADIASDAIQSLDSNGFTVGTNNNVNAAGGRYTWVAFDGSDCTATGTFCVGSYTGDGQATKSVSTGFRPDMVAVKRSGANYGYWMTTTGGANTTFYLAGGGKDTGGVNFLKTLDATGFTVGTHDAVNKNGDTYWFFAFKETAGAMYENTYTGNGSAQSITGVGFQPDFFMMTNSSYSAAWVDFHVTEDYSYTTHFNTDATNSGNKITSLDSDGFSVGDSSSSNGDVYYYVAFGGAVDPTPSNTFQSSTGSYSGTGSSFSVTGLGFQPDLVIIKHTDQTTDQVAVFRTKMMAGDSTAAFVGNTSNFSGGITSLDANGFTVGTNATVNTASDTYYWEAFGNAFDPYDNSGAADFAVGAYVGSTSGGIDNFNILRTGMQPDLVVIKIDNVFGAVWRTSADTTDKAYSFGATADMSNVIQTFNSDGFQVGSDNRANNLAGPYYWFSFKASSNFTVAQYTGDGAARNITGLGFQPDMLWIKRSTAVNGVLRPSTLTGNGNQYFANVANATGIVTALGSDGFSLGTDSTVNENGATYRYAAWNFKTYNQSAFRFYNNADSTDVGSALAAQDTTASLASDGQAFRLRALAHVNGGNLYVSNQTFKLQFAGKGGGTCASPSGTPSSYTDVDGTTAIAYKDNSTPIDGSNLTVNANDPTHSTDTIQAQTYEEANNFTNSTNAITIGRDGLWDFALYDNTAPNGTTYCFRLVLSAGTAFATYGSYAQLTTLANNAPAATTPGTISQVTDDTGYLSFQTTISDVDSNNTKLKVEYSDNNGSTWYDPYLVSATPGSGSVDLDNAQTYQIGTSNAVDTSTGSITLTIVWNTQSVSNGNGSLDGSDQTDIKVRVTPNDSTTDGTAQASAAFEVDNLNPTSAGNLTISARTTASITYTLGTAGSDTNINNYKIYYKQAASGVAESDSLHTTIASGSYTVAGTTAIGSLSANTQYVANIWTYDNYGNKAIATELAGYTNTVQVTSAAIANSTTASQYQVTLTWAYGDGTPIGLKIEQDTSCDGYETTVYDNASALATSPYTVGGLTANTCYKFRFSSYNTAGNLNTASIPETSQITLPPAQPTGLTMASATESQIVWDWNDVTAATDYYVYRSSDNSLIGAVGSATSQYTETVVVSGGAALSPNTQYTVYVRAVSANGAGIASSTASTYTDASVPTALGHDSASQTTAAMKWTWSSGGGQNSFYASTPSPIDNSGWTANAYWNQSGLGTNRQYTLSVKAKNELSEETSAATYSAYTSQAAPTGLATVSVATDSLTVRAIGSMDNLTSGSSGLYFVNSIDNSNSGWTQTNSWANSSLTPNRQYTYTVKARNGDSDETVTATGSFYTLQNAPASTSSSYALYTEITVTADGSLPNLTAGLSGVYFENITAGTNSGWLQANVWQENNLSPLTPYQYRAKARNADGVETAFTALATITTIGSSGGAGQTQDSTPPAQMTPVAVYQCEDGIDNDGDGKIDLVDSGCSSNSDNNESDEKFSPTLDEPQDGTVTNNTKPYIIGTTPSGAMTVDVYIDNIKKYSLISQFDKSFVWKVAAALSDGLHAIYVMSDGISSFTHSILVDTNPPLAPIIDLITIKDQKESNGLVKADLQIQGTAAADTKFVVLYLNGNVLIDTIVVVNNGWAYNLSKEFSSGNNKISAKSIDQAQNISLAPAEKIFEIMVIKEEPKPEESKEEKLAEEKPIEEIKEEKSKEGKPVEPIKETEKKATEEKASKKPIAENPIQPIEQQEFFPRKEVAVEDTSEIDGGQEIPVAIEPADSSGQNFPSEPFGDVELNVEIDEAMNSSLAKSVVEGMSRIISDISGKELEEVVAQVHDTVKAVVKTTKQVQKITVDNPRVEKVNEISKEPALAVATATSVATIATVGATGLNGASALTYLQFLFTQPLFLMVRRKKRGFGLVYNSVTKQPVDLAVVRAYQTETDKLVGTRVTDSHGRYQFILNPGKYYLTVDKNGLKYPCTLLNKTKNDGQYEDVYYGGEIEITEKDVIAKPIPLDPKREFRTAKYEIRLNLARKGQFALTMIGPTLAIVSFIVNPQIWVGGVVVAQLIMYGIFKKLATKGKPSNWGLVGDLETKRGLSRSIVRVFDTKFNKLLDSQVTDGKGRYAFLVGNQEYYLTAEKPGYYAKRSDRFNLANKEEGYLTEKFYLEPHNLGRTVEEAQLEGKTTTLRSELGRAEEKEINGVKKLVRNIDEKFSGEVKAVNQNELHEDFYQVDYLNSA